MTTGGAATTSAEAAASHPTVAATEAVRADRLAGRQLHLVTGARVRLPAALGLRSVLLGTADEGWVLGSGGKFRMLRPDGRLTTIGPQNTTDLYVTEILSDDVGRIASSTTAYGWVDVHVVDLDGRHLLDESVENIGGEVLAAHDGRVYVGGGDGLDVLEEGSGSAVRLTTRSVRLVSVEHDVIFAQPRKSYHRWGPTSLSDPGKLRWRADFEPEALSPDGRHVVGSDGTVRAMADGHIVRRFPVATDNDEIYRYVGWASNKRVLTESVTGGRSRLLACAVPLGTCRPVGPRAAQVSVPTSHAGPYRTP
ncbi:hypothetical protein QWY28_02985 [Nocardioides sp. SOB77]|uniref:SMP-30/gluconolactonase/LRE family protein n=1 Tax=Nocardioides oceani TaxID=3058369 RepID=A0ABT8FB27_9ACTN|nr:hypothetical protein [Nocardioides oceani]MDN4171901.1 hypothetical protein [Nocardioides oceani]